MSGKVLSESVCSSGCAWSKMSRLLVLVSLALISLLLVQSAYASLVVTGTRVIYHAESKGATVEISNTDDFPNIMQAWIDTDPNNKNPEAAKAPFLITPAIAKMEPKGSQTLRIIYTGKDLPDDRESVFYLNILQIPAQNASNAAANQLQFVLLSQLKLFYRPKIADGSPLDTKRNLSFSLGNDGVDGWHIKAENKGSYFASMGSVKLYADGEEIELNSEMLAPHSEQAWRPSKKSSLPKGKLALKIWLINDYGAREEVSYEIAN